MRNLLTVLSYIWSWSLSLITIVPSLILKAVLNSTSSFSKWCFPWVFDKRKSGSRILWRGAPNWTRRAESVETVRLQYDFLPTLSLRVNFYNLTSETISYLNSVWKPLLVPSKQPYTRKITLLFEFEILLPISLFPVTKFELPVTNSNFFWFP